MTDARTPNSADSGKAPTNRQIQTARRAITILRYVRLSLGYGRSQATSDDSNVTLSFLQTTLSDLCHAGNDVRWLTLRYEFRAFRQLCESLGIYLDGKTTVGDALLALHHIADYVEGWESTIRPERL